MPQHGYLVDSPVTRLEQEVASTGLTAMAHISTSKNIARPHDHLSSQAAQVRDAAIGIAELVTLCVTEVSYAR